MSLYNLTTAFAFPTKDSVLDEETVRTMWQLFVAIGKFWDNADKPEDMKSNLLVFMTNRIIIDPNYAAEYRNAAQTIRELILELGETAAYTKLFTDAEANLPSTKTSLARTRRYVSNEFVKLQVSLGGFKAFGSPLNYPGYIGGANIEGRTPYRQA